MFVQTPTLSLLVHHLTHRVGPTLSSVTLGFRFGFRLRFSFRFGFRFSFGFGFVHVCF